MARAADRLVGRSAELASIDGAPAELERRRFVALELAGEPGIGKTVLLEELAARADAAGRLVLSGRAAELERDLPFWTFADALDDYVHSLEPRRLAELPEDELSELAHVLPSLPVPAGAQPPDHRFRTHRAVRRLLELLAAIKPLVLVLDDVHWADSGSIELLGALLRRPPAAPVLIAIAVRPRQFPERLSAALGRAHRTGVLTRVDVGALSESEARELVGTGVGRATAAALYEETGGNSFCLRQLAGRRFPAGDGARAAGVPMAGVLVPDHVAVALSEELAGLAPPARRVLEGAAVAGDPFELELAASAAEAPEADATGALDELLARDLVRTTDVPRRFRFRHPLVRRAVYEAAPGGWRLGAHERCAGVLAQRGAQASTRAHHVEHAARHGDPPRSRSCARPPTRSRSGRPPAPRAGTARRCGCFPRTRQASSGSGCSAHAPAHSSRPGSSRTPAPRCSTRSGSRRTTRRRCGCSWSAPAPASTCCSAASPRRTGGSSARSSSCPASRCRRPSR